MKVSDFILDDFHWSFSRIESFERCPLNFYLQYIKCYPSIEGAFAQYGRFVHECLEKFALGELAEYELSSYYKDYYPQAVTEDFPPNAYVDLGERYYNQGLEYFNNFDGYGDREILAVEQNYFFKIDKYNFTGTIDLECKNEIVDIKTKGKQHLLRLTKKNNPNDYIQMLDGRYIHKDNFKQLYIYSIPFKNKYGKYPKLLSLSMVRINDWYSIEFNERLLEEAYQWAINKITDIYNAEKFERGDGVGDFFCDYICGQRINCKYSSAFMNDAGVIEL